METNTNYTSKTITHGNVIITIRRPILDDGEIEKRKKHIVDSLSCSLRDYLQKTPAATTTKDAMTAERKRYGN